MIGNKSLKIIGRIFTYIVLIVVLLVTVYPLIWMIFGSLKTDTEFYTNIWLWPSAPQWETYVAAWERVQIGQKYINSIIVFVVTMLIIIPVNNCAAYAIARTQFKGKRMLYSYLLLGIMIPAGVLGIPIFTVVMRLGLNNTLAGLILVYSAQAVSFGVFILRSFYISLPKSLEEAAMIDGTSRFGGFVRIILPLATPGIMTQVIFNGLTVWNEYFIASLLINKEAKQTLPIGLSMFINQYGVDYPEMFAALVLVTVPMIIVYLIGQKTFIEGMCAGAVKG